MTKQTPVIATQGHDGRLSVIVDARHVDIDGAPDTCERCGGKGWVWVAEDVEDACPDCNDDWYDAMDDLQGMDLEDQFNALMDAALDERIALPAWEDAREREREAMPAVIDGPAF